MSLHTTADDPRVYRGDDEVKAWEGRCPIARLEKHLQSLGLADRALLDRVAQECEAEVLAARESFRRQAVPVPEEVFEFMYDALPPELERQKEEYLERLRRRGLRD
jgi:TPP-dependent pyruvate/acetoin dehydrogenase alpha subunit